MPPVAAAPPISTAKVARHVLLDSRRAIVHQKKGWLAVADLHYGYEVHRRRQGALLPDWGMSRCEETLRGLIADHRPARLILVGDIMDGSGSASETAALIERLRGEVRDLVCILGNHDRPGLRRVCEFVEMHREDEFVFHHGHRWETVTRTRNPDVETVHVTGHEHPAVRFEDGAGLRLKLPAIVQERIDERTQRWILPAFSPWAAGGVYESSCERLGTWVCGPGRVWQT